MSALPFLAYNYTGDPVVAASPGFGLFAVPLPANTLNADGATGIGCTVEAWPR